ncbi:carboxyl-terminal processing protease [Streptomyces sp. DvalAA-14]|uniref:S41 family peptidase n=1 Tax=unclassified Streptomyces TaxID=2593676 RepID=UPI00081B464B|nr:MULTISPECIES: S41 family peptidase [unclassified Streptomyces]MYS25010.1 PDZ domain-containing protein [Streptomyces sp. SID4948]SCE51356.1 carboxyl-terminal processing protease [Streptomyces sp. DvalAA-14]
MSGPPLFGTPRRIRRGATLALVFGAVLATGAAAGSFAAPAQRGTGEPDGRIVAGPVADDPRSTPASAQPRTGSRGQAAPLTTAARASGGRSGPAGDTARSPALVDTGRIAQEIEDGEVGPETVQKLVSRSGDRWSSFYTAQEYAGLQRALSGRYVGVGLWVRRIDGGRIRIVRVQGGSPAQRAGIRVGDVLASIDRTRCAGLAVTQVVADLRGDAAGDTDDVPGSRVTLGVDRGTHSRQVTLRRATLATEAVTVSRPRQGPTVIKVDAFSAGVGEQVRRAARNAPRGVLLDLRGNSGGLVTEAVATASVFLDGGLVATYDLHGRQQALYASPGGDTAVPLVVLVDGGTMSAAEMLAGALQDRGRAVVVGSRTFGKGSVQMPSTLPDGSVAELTVGHYDLPGGRGVDGKGIAPDVRVPPGQDPVAESRQVFAGLGAPS